VDISIRETHEKDFNDIIEVEKLAFGEDSVANLTADLLKDESGEPSISLLAFDGKYPIGHILFTKATIEPSISDTLMHILAPLAVIPEYQNQGVGGLLISDGIKRLQKIGSKIVFVLGHIEYYPKHGFIPDAANLGYNAPYPIPTEVKDAWMVMPLSSSGLTNFGKVICAKAMDKPEHWLE
jgi:putative acetyltransferase